MTYDEFLSGWFMSYRVARALYGDDIDVMRRDPEIDAMQRLDWIQCCAEADQKVDTSFYEDLFGRLCDLMTTEVHERGDLPLGFFIEFINAVPREGCNGLTRERYDALLVKAVADLLLGDMPLKLKLRAFLTWITARYEFLCEVGLGWPSSEVGCFTAFYTRNREAFLKIRDTDFPTMKHLADYYYTMYEACKTMDRELMSGDIIKVHDFVLDFMRDALVSARSNGYDDFEKKIQKVIDDLKAEVADMPSVLISYSWDDFDIADKIEDGIRELAIVHRDKNDLETGDSLRSFMKSIRDQDFVILVVSDSYLRRRNCMYEVLQLLKDLDEGGSFWDKVAILVTASGVYDAESRAARIRYWTDACERVEQTVSSLPEYAKGDSWRRSRRYASYLWKWTSS